MESRVHLRRRATAANPHRGHRRSGPARRRDRTSEAAFRTARGRAGAQLLRGRPGRVLDPSGARAHGRAQPGGGFGEHPGRPPRTAGEVRPAGRGGIAGPGDSSLPGRRPCLPRVHTAVAGGGGSAATGPRDGGGDARSHTLNQPHQVVSGYGGRLPARPRAAGRPDAGAARPRRRGRGLDLRLDQRLFRAGDPGTR